MGILNVTPDSFSDGGHHSAPAAALARAEAMIEQGADALDVGGESTRPGAKPVPLDEELRRLMPVLNALRDAPVPISVDTYKPAVMHAALDAGASIINDVWGLRQPGAIEAVCDRACGVVVMHMLGEPATMQQHVKYTDVVDQVKEFLAARLSALRSGGVDCRRVMIDPGFGFGKQIDHNLSLLKGLSALTDLPCAGVLVGLSRKSMLSEMVSRAPMERLGASIAAALLAVENGARIIRCHDVAATSDALRVWWQLRSPLTN